MAETKVELQHAWRWMCPACSAENVQPMCVAELSEDDKEQMKVDHGIYGAETGDFVTQPPSVECWNCACDFETTTEINDGE